MADVASATGRADHWRLVHSAGMPPEKVAALDLEQAVDLWTAFTSSPRST